MDFYKWILLGLFTTINMFCGFLYTIQNPLYPKIAESKNASAFEYSLVFGIHEVSVLIGSIFASPIVYFIGPKITLFSCFLFQGLFSVSFGYVDKIDSLTIFLSVSILIRILEGFTFALLFVAEYSFIPTEFSKNKAIIMGVLDMAVAVGFSLGPFIGGELFTLDGFYLPFLVTGIVIFIVSIFIPFIIHNLDNPKREDLSGFAKILSTPSIALNYLIILATSLVLTFNYATLEPFLRKTYLFETFTIGLIFGLCGILYGTLSPLWGYLTVKIKYPFLVTLFGLILNIFGNSLIGPVPIFGIPKLELTCIGLGLFSVGAGMSLISSFVNASNCAKKEGFKDDGGTMSILAACYIAIYSVGTMLGAPIAGALYDAYGFERSTYFNIALLLLVTFLSCGYNLLSRNSAKPIDLEFSKYIDEETKLLGVDFDQVSFKKYFTANK